MKSRLVKVYYLDDDGKTRSHIEEWYTTVCEDGHTYLHHPKSGQILTLPEPDIYGTVPVTFQ